MKTAAVSVRRRQHASIGVGLLITLAIALCVLCVFQWTDQRRLIGLVEDERKTKLELQTTVQEKEQTAKRYSEEITRLEGIRKDLDEAVKTNKTEVGRLKADLKKAEFEIVKTTNQVVVYKEALEKANDAIKQQNESVKLQNEAIKKIAEERVELANKFNKLAEDYNKVVTDYNTLAEQIKAERAAAVAAQEKK